MTPTIAPDDVLVEKVAKAIWHAQWEEAWPRKGGIEHAHALEIARAALEAAGITTLLERERRLREALEQQGLALAVWVNLLQPRVIRTMLDDIPTDEHSWARNPTKVEVQAALEAQNKARAALTEPNPDREGSRDEGIDNAHD